MVLCHTAYAKGISYTCYMMPALHGMRSLGPDQLPQLLTSNGGSRSSPTSCQLLIHPCCLISWCATTCVARATHTVLQEICTVSKERCWRQ